MSKVVIRADTVTKGVGMLEKIGLSSPRSLSSLQVQIKSNGQSTLPAAYATAMTPVLAANWQ
jgi:hypothetical protein